MQNLPEMPRKKTSEKAKTEKGPGFQKLNEVLGTIFYAVWILIGLFFILLTIANFRQGAYRGLFGAQSQQPQSIETPTETTISGIGKVNIACVQEALSTEAITKILQEGNTSSLTGEEKTKLEPCIVEKETAPSPSPEQ